MVLRLILIALAFAGTGCLRDAQQLTADEAERTAWYCEEVAHGLDRDPFELVDEGASEGMRNIALWALGHVEDVTPTRDPSQLERRARRWPLLRDGLRSGALVMDPSGLIALAPEITDEDRRVFSPAVEGENIDRLALNSLLLSRGQLRPGSLRADQLVGALRQARIELGLRAGGRVESPEAADDEERPVRPPTPRRRM